jgi:ubiquinone/menaquinone biosynthesis C-methylase UbiE
LLERGTSDHYQDAALYDLEYDDRTNDVRWYRKLATKHAGDGSILELGAGTGRISVPLARDGHRVLALDRAPQMLARLRERLDDAGELAGSVEPVEGDMTELPFDDASIAMVVSPFNALMHLYSWQALHACFREVARVLRPGGVFAFDVELPDIEWLRWDPKARHAVTPFTHPTTGERLVYSTNHDYDDATQVCHIRLYYDDAPARGRRFRPPAKPKKLVHLAHRQIFPEEVRSHIHFAGLQLTSHDGDFIGVSLQGGVSSQVVVCTKPRA